MTNQTTDRDRDAVLSERGDQPTIPTDWENRADDEYEWSGSFPQYSFINRSAWKRWYESIQPKP